MKNKQNVFRFWLVIIVLASILASPVFLQAQTIPAQPTKFSFYISVVGSYPNNLDAGQDNRFYLQVNNDGNTAINNIRFNTNAPSSWAVNFTPATIDSLSAGSSMTVEVNIIPDNSKRGYQDITVIAQANEAQAVTSIYAQIEGGISYWLWIGIGILALVIAGFVIVFIRQSKKD